MLVFIQVFDIVKNKTGYLSFCSYCTRERHCNVNNVRLTANGNRGAHLLDLSKRLYSRIAENLSRNSRPPDKTDWPRAESGLIAIHLSILNALISRKDVNEREKRATECCPAHECGCVNRG